MNPISRRGVLLDYVWAHFAIFVQKFPREGLHGKDIIQEDLELLLLLKDISCSYLFIKKIFFY